MNLEQIDAELDQIANSNDHQVCECVLESAVTSSDTSKDTSDVNVIMYINDWNFSPLQDDGTIPAGAVLAGVDKNGKKIYSVRYSLQV